MTKKIKNLAFTLIELLTVMTVIAILAGLILSVAGYVQRKGGMSRAQAEIKALEGAAENYKTDNGIYPSDPTPGTATDKLDARTAISEANYQVASFVLYKLLTGDTGGTGAATQSYFPVPPGMCGRPNVAAPVSKSNAVTYLMDPFGNSYGYSTIQQYQNQQGTFN